MPKAKRVFVCQSCGSVHPRWTGKCPDCGTWDALEEAPFDPAAERDPQKGLVAVWADFSEGAPSASATPAQPFTKIDAFDTPGQRLSSSIREFDRVLGGGLVPGSSVMIGGEPGIGKSTLLLQAAFAWASCREAKVLYVSSEESAAQIKLRADRLVGSSPPHADRVFILADTNLARVVEQVRKVQPAVLVIDSVQMLYKSDLPASPGSLTQLRRCVAELVYLAKASGIAVVLVGHVTKDGVLAGPRLLEHLVDVVLAFEGDRYHAHRVVRAVKNRFGTTLEIGLFEMTGVGLKEVSEGAGMTAAMGADAPRPGSVVCPLIAGTRAILVEVQALTATGFPGNAKRKCSGLDPNRLAMLIAVLEQHAGLRLFDRDVFASAVGGIRAGEPAADLALLLAIAGAELRKALPRATAAAGEVGLGGEVRSVRHAEQRLREAARLGFTSILVPSHDSLPAIPGLTPVRVRTIHDAIEHLTEAPATR